VTQQRRRDVILFYANLALAALVTLLALLLMHRTARDGGARAEL